MYSESVASNSCGVSPVDSFDDSKRLNQSDYPMKLLYPPDTQVFLKLFYCYTPYTIKVKA